jgi:eukaryotic-like serine/threonine-protein kinase
MRVNVAQPGKWSIMSLTRILAGRYRLEERLGGGGMSVVWRAYDEVLGRRVAVKVVAGRHANQALARERIRTEARAAAHLNHPHLTKLIDHSAAGSTPYLVMELLEGQTLARRMRAGRLPVRTALEICAQVADALAAAHGSGVVHRDIKPGNVMLTPDGATILDFGIAAFVEEWDEPVPSEEGVPEERIWGTAAYVAPERLTQRRVLPASDVYALGVLLYRALTGRRPWPATGRAEMLAAHVSVEPAPLPTEIGVPAEVAEVCQRCLAKQPQQRPTAREVATILAAAALDPVAAAADVAAVRLVPAPVGPPVGRVGGPRPRFQRRHAATGPGRLRRYALRAGSVTLVAAMVATASFCAVTDRTARQAGPEAGPPPILPGDSPPPGRPEGPRPPYTGPKSPRAPLDRSARAQDTSGRAGGLPGSGAVPVGSDSRTGAGSGGGSAPNPRPRPRPLPTPKPTPSPTPKPTPPPSPTPTPSKSSGGEVGGAINEVVRTLDTIAGTLTARCVGSTASLVSWDALLGILVGDIDRGPAREVGLEFHALLFDLDVTVHCNDSGVPVLG